MEKKTGHRSTGKGVSGFWRKFARYMKKKMQEPESGCGKCAVCHHVCNLLEKKQAPEE